MQLDNEMLDKLESWFETYNPHCMIYSPNIDEEEEDKMFDDYNELIELLERAKSGMLSKDDENVIAFHIECIEEDY
jgi:hypothetical protein